MGRVDLIGTYNAAKSIGHALWYMGTTILTYNPVQFPVLLDFFAEEKKELRLWIIRKC